MVRVLKVGIAALGVFALFVLLAHPLTLVPNAPPPNGGISDLLHGWALVVALLLLPALAPVRVQQPFALARSFSTGHERLSLTCSLLC